MDFKLEFDTATIDIKGADSSVVQTALLGFYAMHGVNLQAPQVSSSITQSLIVPSEVPPMRNLSKTTPPTMDETTTRPIIPKAVSTPKPAPVAPKPVPKDEPAVSTPRSKQLPLLKNDSESVKVWSSDDRITIRKAGTIPGSNLEQRDTDVVGAIINGAEVIAPGVRKTPEGALTYRTQYKCPSCRHAGFRWARATNDYVKCHACDTKITMKPVLGRVDENRLPVPTEDGVYFKAITFDRP